MHKVIFQDVLDMFKDKHSVSSLLANGNVLVVNLNNVVNDICNMEYFIVSNEKAADLQSIPTNKEIFIIHDCYWYDCFRNDNHIYLVVSDSISDSCLIFKE